MSDSPAAAPNVPVIMTRPHLQGLPQHALPQGCSVRWYQPGDDVTWHDVYSKSEQFIKIGNDVHLREFGSDLEVLSKRQAFLMDEDGSCIGTATAWFDNNYNGLPWGRIHWVAIIPERQGKGRGKGLLSVVCNRMVDLGHERAYLATSTGRVAAINMYLKFGFRPQIRNMEDEIAWKAVNHLLSYPLLP